MVGCGKGSFQSSGIKRANAETPAGAQKAAGEPGASGDANGNPNGIADGFKNSGTGAEAGGSGGAGSGGVSGSGSAGAGASGTGVNGTNAASGSGGTSKGSAAGNTSTASTQPSTAPVVPPAPAPARFTGDGGGSLGDGDSASIERCLKQWPGHPFVAGGVYSVRKISFAFSLGGLTLGGNDGPTPAPKLVLLDNSVNVGLPGLGGVSTYNFLNPNGYYCVKSQVNVLASVNINLHCQARMASSESQFSVLSNISGEPAQNQVNILSNVAVTRVCY